MTFAVEKLEFLSVNNILTLGGNDECETGKALSGSELFIVDNSDTDWKVLRYLHDWCQIAKGIDIATGYFELFNLAAQRRRWRRT